MLHVLYNTGENGNFFSVGFELYVPLKHIKMRCKNTFTQIKSFNCCIKNMKHKIHEGF